MDGHLPGPIEVAVCEQTTMAQIVGGGGGRLSERGRGLGRGQGVAGGGRRRGEQGQQEVEEMNNRKEEVEME